MFIVFYMLFILPCSLKENVATINNNCNKTTVRFIILCINNHFYSDPLDSEMLLFPTKWNGFLKEDEYQLCRADMLSFFLSVSLAQALLDSSASLGSFVYFSVAEALADPESNVDVFLLLSLWF